MLKVSPEKFGTIITEAYPLPAPRLRNSCLTFGKFEPAFQFKMRFWKHGVQRMLNETQY